eukprot:Gb_19062 [translate_table: standard]
MTGLEGDSPQIHIKIWIAGQRCPAFSTCKTSSVITRTYIDPTESTETPTSMYCIQKAKQHFMSLTFKNVTDLVASDLFTISKALKKPGVEVLCLFNRANDLRKKYKGMP